MSNEIKPVYQTKETTCSDWVEVDEERYNRRIANTELYETRILYPAAAYEANKQKTYALALVINDLIKMVTYEGETKDEFIKRVKSILSVDPDLLICELAWSHNGKRVNVEVKILDGE